MNNDWYLLRNGQIFGPYDLSQLQLMAVAGQLTPTDLLSEGTSGNWAPPHVVVPVLAAAPAAPLLPPAPPALPSVVEVAHADHGGEDDVVSRVRPRRSDRSTWGQYKLPILAGGGAFVFLAVIAVAGVALLRPQRTSVAHNVKHMPPTSQPHQPQPQPQPQPQTKTKSPKGPGEPRQPIKIVETVFPKTQAGSGKVSKDWVAERGAPLETHSFRKLPHIEVLVWRTGSDEYDMGIVDRTTGVATLKSNLTRFEVEGIVDAYVLGMIP